MCCPPRRREQQKGNHCICRVVAADARWRSPWSSLALQEGLCSHILPATPKSSSTQGGICTPKSDGVAWPSRGSLLFTGVSVNTWASLLPALWWNIFHSLPVECIFHKIMRGAVVLAGSSMRSLIFQPSLAHTSLPKVTPAADWRAAAGIYSPEANVLSPREMRLPGGDFWSSPVH